MTNSRANLAFLSAAIAWLVAFGASVSEARDRRAPTARPSAEAEALDLVAWRARGASDVRALASALPLSEAAREEAFRLLGDLKLESAPVPRFTASAAEASFGEEGQAIQLELSARAPGHWKSGGVFVRIGGRPLREVYDELTVLAAGGGSGRDAKPASRPPSRAGAAFALFSPFAVAQVRPAQAANRAPAPASAAAAAMVGSAALNVFGYCLDFSAFSAGRCSVWQDLSARVSPREIVGFECDESGRLRSVQRLVTEASRLVQTFEVLERSSDGAPSKIQTRLGQGRGHNRCDYELSGFVARGAGVPTDDLRRIDDPRRAEDVRNCSAPLGRDLGDYHHLPLRRLHACCGDEECRSRMGERARAAAAALLPGAPTATQPRNPMWLAAPIETGRVERPFAAPAPAAASH